MIVINDIKQGSQEWLDVRLGKVTASKVSAIMTNGKGGNMSKTAETYMMDLIAEILTGEPKPFFENDSIRWGNDNESSARAMYEIREWLEVKEVAFIKHSEFVGVSPDGLVGDDGLLEIKCPNTTTQIKRALSGDYSADYKAQIQMQLWVSGRQWCDFLSFDPRLDCDAGYLIQRVERDEEYIEDMKTRVEKFVNTMQETIKKLKGE